jgi:hypothetical protein
MDPRPSREDIRAQLKAARESLAADERRRSRTAQAAPEPPPAATKPVATSAEGWVRFEERTRQRRIERRSATARAALKHGKLAHARAAVAEIQELDPDHPEVVPLLLELDAAELGSRTRRKGSTLAAALALVGVVLTASWLTEPVAPAPLAASQFSGIASLVDGTLNFDPDLIAADDTIANAPIESTSVPPAPVSISVPRRTESLASLATPAPPPPPPVELVPPPPTPQPSFAPLIVETSRTIASSPPSAPVSLPAVENDRPIRQAIERYRAAYERLDARSAQQVWPGVDELALARAFGGLRSQALIFDECDVRIRGTTATAACAGSARYIPKIGSQQPRIEPRVWDFTLRQTGADWKIDTVRVEQ